MQLPDISNNPQAKRLLQLIDENRRDEASAFIESGAIRNIDAQAVIFSFTDDEINNKASAHCENILRLSVQNMPSAPIPRDAITDNAIAGNISGVYAILQREILTSEQLWRAARVAIAKDHFDIARAILDSQREKSLATSANMAKHILASDKTDADATSFLVDYISQYEERSAKSLGHCISNVVIDNDRKKFDALLTEINTRQLDVLVNEAIEIAMEDGKPEYIAPLLPFLNSVPDFDVLDIEQFYPQPVQREFDNLTPETLPIKIALLVRWHIAMCNEDVLSLMGKAPLWLRQYYLNELNRKISD